MGPPGSGKGTQAARIAEMLRVDMVSSGDLFREHREQDTELGRQARSYMDKGVYVPDEITIRMMMEWINAPGRSKGFVLDGFPRTLAQAEALDRALEGSGGIDKVLFIKVSEDELARRLGGRLICRLCQTPFHTESSRPESPGKCDRCGGELYQREDDKPEVVKTRIKVYMDETEPVVQHYQRAGKLLEASGEGPIEQVGSALVEAIS